MVEENQGFQPGATGAVQSGWYAKDVYANVGDSVDDIMLQTYNAYSPSKSGAFPNYFPQSVNRNKIWAEISRFTPEQVVRLKQRLWAAGYLVFRDEDGKENPFTAPPVNASLNDQSFIDAFNLFTQDVATAKDPSGQPVTMDSFLNSRIQDRAPSIREATMAEFDLAVEAEFLQTWAEENIGRNFTDQEVQQLFAIVQRSDTSAFQQARSMDRPFGSPANDVAAMSEPLFGGGPDSKSINWLKSLGEIYGTSVISSWRPISDTSATEAMREGRAAILSGDVESLKRLEEWANSQMDTGQSGTSNPLFESVNLRYDNGVDKDPTGLYLAVNDYARPPALTGVSTDYRSFSDETARFLQSIKRPGSSAYNWEGDGVHRGAYGLSDEIWNHYTKNVFKNIDSNDHSAAAQDAVARAYAQDLFSGDHNYRDWRLVAMAFLKNEQVALNEKQGRQNEGDDYTNPLITEDDSNRISQIIAGMSNPINLKKGVIMDDPYTTMYGETGMGVPTVSDPYAGRPRDAKDYRAKEIRAAREQFFGKSLSNRTFKSVLNVLSNYDSSVMGEVE